MDPTARSLAALGDATGLRVVRAACGLLVARADVADTLLELGFGPDREPRLGPSELVGKGPLEELVAGGERLVVRRFRHGGLLRWLTGARFADPTRPFTELALQRELSRRGVRTPEVVAARAVRARPAGWRLLIATVRVPAALDLGQALAERERGELPLGRWRSLVGEAGGLVARLHGVGFLHADLTPRNLLVERSSLEAGEPRLWVLDLDRSRFVSRIADVDRRANLRRLLRHLQRLERDHGLALGRTDLARFLRAYQPDPAARRADWRGIAEDTERPRGWHALGWWLERRLGRGRSGAERHLAGGAAERLR
jgi:tRNA A-37 threonylcarbamoyl transferase component Bud32